MPHLPINGGSIVSHLHPVRHDGNLLMDKIFLDQQVKCYDGNRKASCVTGTHGDTAVACSLNLFHLFKPYVHSRLDADFEPCVAVAIYVDDRFEASQEVDLVNIKKSHHHIISPPIHLQYANGTIRIEINFVEYAKGRRRRDTLYKVIYQYLTDSPEPPQSFQVRHPALSKTDNILYWASLFHRPSSSSARPRKEISRKSLHDRLDNGEQSDDMQRDFASSSTVLDHHGSQDEIIEGGSQEMSYEEKEMLLTSAQEAERSFSDQDEPINYTSRDDVFGEEIKFSEVNGRNDLVQDLQQHTPPRLNIVTDSDNLIKEGEILGLEERNESSVSRSVVQDVETQSATLNTPIPADNVTVAKECDKLNTPIEKETEQTREDTSRKTAIESSEISSGSQSNSTLRHNTKVGKEKTSEEKRNVSVRVARYSIGSITLEIEGDEQSIAELMELENEKGVGEKKAINYLKKMKMLEVENAKSSAELIKFGYLREEEEKKRLNAQLAEEKAHLNRRTSAETPLNSSRKRKGRVSFGTIEYENNQRSILRKDNPNSEIPFSPDSMQSPNNVVYQREDVHTLMSRPGNITPQHISAGLPPPLMR